MTLRLSSRTSISTNPNPRPRPVALSNNKTTRADLTFPCCLHNSFSRSSVAVDGNPSTYTCLFVDMQQWFLSTYMIMAAQQHFVKYSPWREHHAACLFFSPAAAPVSGKSCAHGVCRLRLFASLSLAIEEARSHTKALIVINPIIITM